MFKPLGSAVAKLEFQSEPTEMKSNEAPELPKLKARVTALNGSLELTLRLTTP